MRKRTAAITIFGISVTTLLLFYQLGNAVLDAAQSLFNVNVPEEYYGILALFFIFISVAVLLKQKGW